MLLPATVYRTETGWHYAVARTRDTAATIYVGEGDRPEDAVRSLSMTAMQGGPNTRERDLDALACSSGGIDITREEAEDLELVGDVVDLDETDGETHAVWST